MTQHTSPSLKQRQAICPSCHGKNRFRYAGEQRWPVKVAKATGLDPVVHLWHCDGCNTTISESELR